MDSDGEGDDDEDGRTWDPTALPDENDLSPRVTMTRNYRAG